MRAKRKRRSYGAACHFPVLVGEILMRVCAAADNDVIAKGVLRELRRRHPLGRRRGKQ